jgi:hypothetical protein
MAENQGTLVSAPIKTFSDQDTFPTHYANDGAGGWVTAATVTAMLAIPTERLEEGQVCFVLTPPGPYQWLGGTWVAGISGVGTGGGGGTTPPATFIWTQDAASAVWTVVHNLGCLPAVSVVDSAGSSGEGDVDYLIGTADQGNKLTITFSSAFSGQAFLN